MKIPWKIKSVVYGFIDACNAFVYFKNLLQNDPLLRRQS